MHTPRPTGARAGLTILEVVFAMAILGLVVMASMSALSYVHGSQARDQRTLAAAEIANRLLLMYIDDPNSPWNEGDTISWPTGEQYRWDLVRSEVKIDSAVPPPTEMNTQGGGFGLDRIHMIRARVWLDAPYGGTQDFSIEAPHAEISRLMDPIANMTRPDSSKRMFDNYRGSMTDFVRSGRVAGWKGREGISSTSSGGKR